MSREKPNTGSMTISAFADRTLKWYDSPCPATDTGLSADNSHEPAGKGGEVCGSSSSLCTKCAAISNTLGMRSVLEASSTSQGCQSISTEKETPNRSHSQSYSSTSWSCGGCHGQPAPWSLGPNWPRYNGGLLLACGKFMSRN